MTNLCVSACMSLSAEYESDSIIFVNRRLQKIWGKSDYYEGPSVNDIAESYMAGSGHYPDVVVKTYLNKPNGRRELVATKRIKANKIKW